MWRSLFFDLFSIISIFVFHVLDVKLRSTLSTDVLDVFFSGVQASLQLCLPLTLLSHQVSRPLGRQPIPAFSHPLPISALSILLPPIVIAEWSFQSLPCWQPSMPPPGVLKSHFCDGPRACQAWVTSSTSPVRGSLPRHCPAGFVLL